MNGEEVCEDHGFDKTQCESIACCHWDDGDCWSAVGNKKCDMNGEEVCEGHEIYYWVQRVQRVQRRYNFYTNY